MLQARRSLLRFQMKSLEYFSTTLQAGRLPVRVPDKVDFFFNLPNPSSHIMALGSTQPLAEMSTRNFPGDKKRPTHKADNLTAICEPNVSTCVSHQPLATLRIFTASNKDNLTFYLLSNSCRCIGIN
jgi:hypothetical protein